MATYEPDEIERIQKLYRKFIDISSSYHLFKGLPTQPTLDSVQQSIVPAYESYKGGAPKEVVLNSWDEDKKILKRPGIPDEKIEELSPLEDDKDTLEDTLDE